MDLRSILTRLKAIERRVMKAKTNEPLMTEIAIIGGDLGELVERCDLRFRPLGHEVAGEQVDQATHAAAVEQWLTSRGF